MCHIWKLYRDNKSLYRKELSGEEWLRFIRRCIDDGIQHIDLTGGEPFLKDGFADLVTVVLTECKFACVTTNALQSRHIAAEIEQILRRSPCDAVFVVSVSLDGLPDVHDRLRGIPQSFESSVALLQQLKCTRKRFPNLVAQISFTITDDNYHNLVPLVDYLLSSAMIESADQFSFRPAQSSAYYRRSNVLTKTSEILAAIEGLQQKHSFGTSSSFINGVKLILQEPMKPVLPCYAMFVSCWIDPYGNVAPCVTWTDRTVGNVRDTNYDLLPIWKSREASSLRECIRSGRCPVCWTDCEACDSLYYAQSQDVDSCGL